MTEALLEARNSFYDELYAEEMDWGSLLDNLYETPAGDEFFYSADHDIASSEGRLALHTPLMGYLGKVVIGKRVQYETPGWNLEEIQLEILNVLIEKTPTQFYGKKPSQGLAPLILSNYDIASQFYDLLPIEALLIKLPSVPEDSRTISRYDSLPQERRATKRNIPFFRLHSSISSQSLLESLINATASSSTWRGDEEIPYRYLPKTQTDDDGKIPVRDLLHELFMSTFRKFPQYLFKHITTIKNSPVSVLGRYIWRMDNGMNSIRSRMYQTTKVNRIIAIGEEYKAQNPELVDLTMDWIPDGDRDSLIMEALYNRYTPMLQAVYAILTEEERTRPQPKRDDATPVQLQERLIEDLRITEARQAKSRAGKGRPSNSPRQDAPFCSQKSHVNTVRSVVHSLNSTFRHHGLGELDQQVNVTSVLVVISHLQKVLMDSQINLFGSDYEESRRSNLQQTENALVNTNKRPESLGWHRGQWTEILYHELDETSFTMAGTW